MRRLRLRRGGDPLGLRRALSDRLLPGLVAAMALLAALSLAGAAGAAGLGARWAAGAGVAATVTVPDPAPARMAQVLALLRGTPGLAEARAVPPAELRALLRPWLGPLPAEGEGAAGLPGVVELRLDRLPDDPVAFAAGLAARLAAAAPGASVESHGIWVARLAALAARVRAVALAVLALVGAVAAAVVAMATRAGLSARREAIEVLHALGAPDRVIAARFAARVALLAAAGALAGVLAAAPALAGLAALAAPLLDEGAASRPWSAPPWAALAALVPLAGAVGWLAAAVTVRLWLRRLP